ncbi:hypothetical protein LTR28_003054, partial [Elasticomyces elasticus]
MPPARMLRRAVTNENDENAGTTRLTRAKAAALGGPNDAAAGDAVKKPLLSKRATATGLSTNAVAQPRKRAALGD